jgi:sensor histidine kinase regulating citrate/malate metabolism
MSINFQTIQDSLFALLTVVGIAVLFAVAIIGASGLVQRDKARNRKAAATTAATLAPVTVTASDVTFHPTQTDRVRELVSSSR